MRDRELFRYTPGTAPLLVSIPHAGTYVPPELAARMTEAGRALPDTDWHVDRLYDFLDELGVGVLTATHSRYVVDLNRAPDGAPLYPGQAETAACPVTTFDSAPIWRDGEEPGEAEVAQRIVQYWQPYHDRLRTALDELRSRHGRVLLWDAHSIRSRVPLFFAGELPVYNFGTNGGASCNAKLAQALLALASDGSANGSAILDGRFKGGYITRHYGAAGSPIESIQLELAQRAYMDEVAGEYRSDTADRTRLVLRAAVRLAAERDRELP